MTVMDASVLVVVTYPVQLLVKSLIQHCQHHWSLVPKRRREAMNHTKNLKKILMQRCWKFSVTMTFSVSEISDNDSPIIRKFISSKQLERTTCFFLQKVVASLVYIISGYCPEHSLGTAVRTQLADTLAAAW